MPMSLQQRIVNIYAPARCTSCGLEGSSLCHGCMADISTNHLSRCFMCGAQTDDFSTCSKCRRKTTVDNVWVAVDYSGTVKNLVQGFKYERQRSSARALGELIDRSLPYLDEATLITHIPTATARVRTRGYDHAMLLAREIGNIRGLKHKALLGRIGQSQQMGASRKIRLEQIEKSFIAIKPSQIKGADILLIDDVLTTGSTLREAAKELKQAGAKSIIAAVVGHHGN